MSRAGIKGKQGFPTLGANPHTIQDGVVRIDIGKGAFALVNEADYALVSEFRWYFEAIGYVATTKGPHGKPIRMHRLIMGILGGQKPRVDHINHDKTDNRRQNLRLCYGNGNTGNMVKPSHGSDSKFKGVCRAREGRWRAYIKISRVQYHLGSFTSELDAAKAYDAAATVVFGKFAFLNFPDAPPTPAHEVAAWKRINAGRVPTSRTYGVDYLKQTGKWRARVSNNHLGVFQTEEEAAKAVEDHFLTLRRSVNTHPQLQ